MGRLIRQPDAAPCGDRARGAGRRVGRDVILLFRLSVLVNHVMRQSLMDRPTSSSSFASRCLTWCGGRLGLGRRCERRLFTPAAVNRCGMARAGRRLSSSRRRSGGVQGGTERGIRATEVGFSRRRSRRLAPRSSTPGSGGTRRACQRSPRLVRR